MSVQCRCNVGACRCNSTSPITCCSSHQQRLGESETRFLASFCKPHLLADPGLRKFSSEEPANKENQSSKTKYFLLQPRNIMMRHVIVSSRAFTIEQLVEKSLRSPLRTVKTEVSNEHMDGRKVTHAIPPREAISSSRALERLRLTLTKSGLSPGGRPARSRSV